MSFHTLGSQLILMFVNNRFLPESPTWKKQDITKKKQAEETKNLGSVKNKLNEVLQCCIFYFFKKKMQLNNVRPIDENSCLQSNSSGACE